MPNSAHKLNRSAYLKIAASSETDPRTAQDYFEGRRKTTPRATAAIRAALRTLGIADPQVGGANVSE